jgi:hypothetical protein
MSRRLGAKKNGQVGFNHLAAYHFSFQAKKFLSLGGSRLGQLFCHLTQTKRQGNPGPTIEDQIDADEQANHP